MKEIDMPRNDERFNEPLKVEVFDGLLTISIGLETLAYAVNYGTEFEHIDWAPNPGDDNLYTDFGQSIVLYLNAEEEDGSTPVHRMFDEVALEAFDQGAEGFGEILLNE